MTSHQKPRRLGRTLLLAAVAAALLTLTALAVGYTIHQRRQAQLRETLQIDASRVTSYAEYETPGKPEGGVALLSALRNGDHQYVYLNVSPVEREEAANFPDSFGFYYTLDGKVWSAANPALDPERSVSRAEMGAAVLEDAYDEATRTLTLCCIVESEWLEQNLDASGRAELRLVKMTAADDASGSGSRGEWLSAHEASCLCGVVTLSPTALEMRLVTFENAVVTEPASGRSVTVEALELSPTGAVWRLRYDGAEALYTTRRDESWSDEETAAFYAMQAELCALEDYVLQRAVLHFADGAQFAPGGAISSGFEDGAALPRCEWLAAVDIHALERVTIGDVELRIAG